MDDYGIQIYQNTQANEVLYFNIPITVDVGR